MVIALCFQHLFKAPFISLLPFPRTKGTNYCNLTSGHPDVPLPCVLFQTLSGIMVIAFSVCTSPPCKSFYRSDSGWDICIHN